MKSFLICFIFLSSLFAKDENKIVVAGPIATVSHPIFHMIQNDVLKDIGKKIEFRLWNNPDELRAIILKGDADFIALPTNVASNLYNKGVNLKLLNVSVWGILQMISRDPNLKTIKDFKDKEIVIPFRADMPDIVFQELAKKSGLNPKKDFKIQYVANPVDAMQMLILRRVDHALLAEPAVSIALRKTKSFPVKLVAPELYRSVNLQEEWGKLFNVEAKIPQAGLAYIGDTKGKEELINKFLIEYEKSLSWYKQNPKEAASLAVKNLPMLDVEGLADSIEHVVFENIKAQDAINDLEFFFGILKENDAKLIGGKLPNKELYYK
ncbi:ABC transporter substrate-binding protein [Aliarcobacter butzleri]|uniref:ABC transporter substrate-binding protein n=1 Tax=Aliarcobacter butzleri TaxID=28197 RepID=UPI0012600016|nr:ABC transporter substrate-binding protein [Aliarcobacter butzleri]MCT7571875.1 ABC transporter substrate-binding protein [Aliarcobacter butzleri]MCT7575925.1 ABC transporter substrate-binding protein [Aliarcobacter butzleri]MCT7598157.1 ABC transporter substrate-binding protein [Aliarcobacter butzleri]MDK2047559.1 ABC transporter substrate-binding protein [Aliarcobacter butzleri]MDK2064982.1 ABC transporter substrate-binding protein [Aliarcobacter butzleri]